MSEPALLQRLAAADSHLHARLTDLRATVADWLSYVPATFPHYTRHTIGHSDEIVRQLSGLLFVDSDPERPVSPVSPMELYVLSAASYLHDAGMVVPDAEKQELLDSPNWRAWTQDGPATAQWQAIEEVRQKAHAGEESAAKLHFAADLQTRFLISEYIRRNHHLRVDDLLRDQPELLAAVSDGDPSLAKTVTDVCIAHGLSTPELATDARYPVRRDIQGQPVDPRFLAILLRLGDLLDLSHDRACPLLLNAASPLPAGSAAHWSQYRRIIHRVTSPERIELRAECETQEEHRLLRDWCQWLVEETWHAQALLSKSDRHRGWRPPLARLDEPDPTMIIEPAEGARYVPADWRIESDPAVVLGRFATDIYSGDLAFLKELLQNAFDATRCRVYAERGPNSQSDGWWTPEGLEACREYPVDVTVSRVEKTNDSSDITEERQILTVTDRGIGMTAEVLKRFLLHAGRSFYESPQFRQQYGFVAASRFGVGFLSVFGVSDHVVVRTRARGTAGEAGIQLDLRGPRNYILVESLEDQPVGTSIEVELREQVDAAAVIDLVRQSCPRVEFPVRVSAEGQTDTVEAEVPAQFETKVVVDQAGVASFRIRAIPLRSSIAKGELYVFEQVDDQGKVEWGFHPWEIGEWAKTHVPMLSLIPRTPSARLALHGMSFGVPGGQSEMAIRLDVRASQDQRRLNLSREARLPMPPGDVDLDAEIEKIVLDHFAERSADRGYKAKVIKGLNIPPRIASRFPGVIEIWRTEPENDDAFLSTEISLEEFNRETTVTVMFGNGKFGDLDQGWLCEMLGSGCAIRQGDPGFSLYWRNRLAGLRPESFRWSSGRSWLAVRCSSGARRGYSTNGEAIVRPPEDFESGELLVAMSLEQISLDTVFFNRGHPMVIEMARVADRSLEVDERFKLDDIRSRGRQQDPLELFLGDLVHSLQYVKIEDRNEYLSAAASRYLGPSEALDNFAGIVHAEHQRRVFSVASL